MSTWPPPRSRAQSASISSAVGSAADPTPAVRASIAHASIDGQRMSGNERDLAELQRTVAVIMSYLLSVRRMTVVVLRPLIGSA